MLLFDLSGIVTHACINLHHESQEDVTIDVVRHVAFSILLHYKTRFGRQYGKPVICTDNRPYWRSNVFPYYKKNRKRLRDESKIDWKAFNKHFGEIVQDIGEYSPYPTINAPKCEADDSIFVLTQYAYARNEPVMIVSSDKDMVQLQTIYKGVKQYSPNRKRMLTPKDMEYDLLTHIIKGDAVDGIPNIFSPDDILVDPQGRRQKSVTAKMLAAIGECDDPLDWDGLDEESRSKFKRNRLLIDAQQTPKRIKERVIKCYEDELAKNKKNKMMSYVRKHRLRQLLPKVQGF